MRDSKRISAMVESQKALWASTHPEAMMITLEEYVGSHKYSPDWTKTAREAAGQLLIKVDKLRIRLEAEGVVFHINPKTRSCISGEVYGGFRPLSCPIGAPGSSHKTGHGIDIFDPDGAIDAYLMANQPLLDEHGIYIEHPDHTPTWSHWTDRPPKSGKHVFAP